MPRGRRARPDRAGRHPVRDAAQLHRLRDVGHRRPCAARRPGRAQAGPRPDPVRDARRRLPARPRLLQVLAGRRRRHGQLPPARRQRDLRRAGADGAALVDADAADRQPGQLRLAGQRPARGHAVHRMPPRPAGDGDAAGHQRGHRRLPGELRRPLVRARRAAEPVPQPADQRVRGDRGRHGHQDPAAQPARGGRRRRLVPGQLRRVRRGTAGRADGAGQGPGLPDPRPDRRPARHQGRLPDRARLDHHAGRRRGRGDSGAAPAWSPRNCRSRSTRTTWPRRSPSW